MSPCALHDFFLGAIVMQTPMAHGKKHLRIICIMGFKPWDSSGTGGFKAPCFWWFASSLPCKQKLMSHHPTKCWRVCYIRYQLGHLGSMLFQAVSSFPKTVSSMLGLFTLRCQLHDWLHGPPREDTDGNLSSYFARWMGDPWLDFRLSRKIVLFFFLGHNSKYDSFFLAFQVFAPFTWYKTSLLPESVTVKFDVLCWKKNTCTTMSCWNFMTLGRAWCHRSSFVG